MPYAYVIGNVDVTDAEQYSHYQPLSSQAIAAHGGEILARGGRSEVLEGSLHTRTVIVRFADFSAATKFYHSAEYEAARNVRAGAAQMNMVVVEGI
jgi:uncharacterized protein (DUF1330 family)